MMDLPTSAPLTDWVRRLVDDEASLHSSLETPVVVWEGDLAEAHWVTKPPEHAPSPENPVVFLVKKVQGRGNPFPAGVTMGRAEHNDLILPHASVSRFHAYLTPDPGQIARWNVIDAASRNGTLVDGVPLQPNSAAPLGGATRINVGEMALTFLSVEAFLRWLTKVVEAV